MNQLNLKNLTGKVIKQGDFESPFRFQLLDYQQKPVTKHDGLEATVRIGKGNEIVYQTTATVQKGIVEFEFENAIPIGIYRVEIVVSESVYPSDHSVWLTVESSMVEYQPQEVYRVIELTKEELSKMVMGDMSIYDDTEIKRRLTELESNRQTFDISPINERLETLESKVDKDTIYDDTELKERVQVLENKPVIDLSDYAKHSELSTFDNSENERRLAELESRPLVEADGNLDLRDIHAKIAVLESKNSALKTKLEAITKIEWIEPELLNGWSNNESSVYAKFGYTKDASGFVHLKGMHLKGGASIIMFYLPRGYRPTHYIRLSASVNGVTLIGVTITPGGTIEIRDSRGQAPSNVDLTGLNFHAGN